eukprot:gnl/Chilomastix_caulleri/2411.p1 GENE.gnl/Chilomastix_caulleri/2411~~gnl/Chilomastix_caulleri/2411.p1  ORF type:complete len:64 (-),score=10.24 gnl/Chilomastix_caulleri/2411:34-225(-)
MISLGLLVIIIFGVFGISHEEISYPITPASTIKMLNVGARGALNSHTITYGSGSGGQSVTTYK